MVLQSTSRPLGFNTTNTLIRSRRHVGPTKGPSEVGYVVVPSFAPPNVNGSLTNTTDYISPPRRPRPIKHWRKRLVPPATSSLNQSGNGVQRSGYSRSLHTLRDLDAPGGGISHYTKSNSGDFCTSGHANKATMIIADLLWTNRV
mgnify:CR=1 FL=1|jgi:hypothetical protein